MLDWLASMMPLLADIEMSVTRAALASLLCFIILELMNPDSTNAEV